MAVAHLGLGAEGAVDAEVFLRHGEGTQMRRGVTVDQVLKVKR